MTDQVIKIGIDLGTTNSSVAINREKVVEIVKNAVGDEYTPSVFGIDKAKNKVVGKKAYTQLFLYSSEEEAKNYKAEVKRSMGTSEGYYFDRLKKEMMPEEVSAEILKYIKESIVRKYPKFDTSAAVITVPAYFTILESEATKRAGELAGFEYVVLLQEPIAAAMAYGFDNADDDNWIIYDLGGGTFDVALISAKDNVLSVRGHNGNNFLGGKDFDNLIVDKFIKPKILESFKIKNFSRDQSKSKFDRLKYLAEEAKKELSQYDQVAIQVEGIGEDDEGQEISMSIELKRVEFEKLIKPLVDKTILLTKETIKDSGIKASSVSKIVLVGGPTQIPYIRERLQNDLKIEVDSSVDPLTVVARGACIYAASQKIPQKVNKQPKTKGDTTLNLKLNYDPMTSEDEQMITGAIEGLNDNSGDYYIQIQSDNGSYSSSKIVLRKGKFRDTVSLEKKKSNLFWIYLFDDKGNSIPLEPDSFTITHGLTVSGAPIAHSIGVVVAEKGKDNQFINNCESFFEKGSILPLKLSKTFHTARKVKKGDKDNVLPIWVYEGESNIPDRNIYICDLAITGKDVPYDLPEGTDVDVTINVSESREVQVEAFIPTIDLTLSARATIRDKDIKVDDLDSELLLQKGRLTTLDENLSQTEKEEIENLISSIDDSLESAESDQDDRRKADKEIKDLKTKLDNLEEEKEMPQLIKEFNSGVAEIEKLIIEVAVDDKKEMFREQLGVLRSEGNRAIEKEDKPMLIKANEQVRELSAAVVLSNPQSWVYHFRQLATGEHNYSNETEAQYYIEKGNKAIEANDVDELKRCVVSLIALLPADKQKEINSGLSGITR